MSAQNSQNHSFPRSLCDSGYPGLVCSGRSLNVIRLACFLAN